MNDAPRLLSSTPRPPLSAPERTGAILLIVLGFVSLITGSLYVWNHMAAPFRVDYFGPKLVLGDEKRAAEIALQRKTDTDKDGLSDYDERNIFLTSPYLADSDSDGTPDNVEVNAGTDPNCAPNQPCANAVVDAISAGGNAQALEAERAKLGSEIQRIQASLSSLENVTPDQVRQMLLQSGIPQDQIDLMTDDEVTQIYSEVLKQLDQVKGGLKDLSADGQSTSPAATTTPDASTPQPPNTPAPSGTPAPAPAPVAPQNIPVN